MCRQYQIKFYACGHVENSDLWTFPCLAAHAKFEMIVIKRPQHCFQCLKQEQMPEWQRYVAEDLVPNLPEATRLFEQILSHHERHPDGPQHFDKADIEALASMNPRLSDEDRRFIRDLEERLDAALWVEKENVQDHRTLKDKRNMILQLRFAHLTARVERAAYIAHNNARIFWAKGELQSRIDLRVRAVLQDVSDEEIEALDEDDKNCSICYSRLQNNGPHPGRVPRRLPCGHILCLDCAHGWLGADPGTCPSCRADFDLAPGHATDFMAVVGPVLAAVARDMADPPTPWWVVMLRAA
ncbi:hypothetical protein L207DRAFT_535455 [Hyaloscypha variabilis F]|uniref:RING-type domain-containing protein n=1 Tax=Hyaloscypha variabilis (strain UAMH 11265 / GT02V1 / F) TaxID=1149755 RepID=A0A2J6R4J0_HYAVF|nr:hypothetical protein L207DRAFT_535455 [Hyaloscypha variabilis F]